VCEAALSDVVRASVSGATVDALALTRSGSEPGVHRRDDLPGVDALQVEHCYAGVPASTQP
jgi:hypothetical protein